MFVGGVSSTLTPLFINDNNMSTKIYNFGGKVYSSDQGWGQVNPNYNYWFDPDGIEINERSGCARLSITNNKNYEKQFGAGQLASIDKYTYGIFKWHYDLPIGRNLWPALWLTGANSWPPEIDVMEGWPSNKGIYKNRTNYRRLVLFNDIQPRLHCGTPETHKSWSNKVFGTEYTWRCHQNVNKTNNCRLEWYPDIIRVYYNGYKVFECTDKEILKHYHDQPMIVVMNNAVTSRFTEKDLSSIKRDFYIWDFDYIPYTDLKQRCYMPTDH